MLNTDIYIPTTFFWVRRRVFTLAAFFLIFAFAALLGPRGRGYGLLADRGHGLRQNLGQGIC